MIATKLVLPRVGGGHLQILVEHLFTNFEGLVKDSLVLCRLENSYHAASHGLPCVFLTELMQCNPERLSA